jgi:acyl-CoA thioesterase-1
MGLEDLDGVRAGAAGAAGPRRRLLRAAAAFAALGSVAVAGSAFGKPADGASPRLLVVGDSLSAEYGLRRGAGWVALLEQRLKARKLDWEVVNASISGETTAGGLARLPALLAKHAPRAVVIELGGNDALRGLPLESTGGNLSRMARLSREAGARVLIAGMQIPPNYGRAYAERFAGLFADVAREHGAALVPFLLAGVAEREELFQSDRIHPTAQAQAIMLDNVWPVLLPLLGTEAR